MKLLAAVFAAALLVAGAGGVYAADLTRGTAAYDAVAAYLDKNAVVIPDLSVIPGKSFDENDLRQMSVFLSGEMHGTHASSVLNLALVKYLHAHAGVKYLLAEYGYSMGKMLDEYISGGDESLLYTVFASAKGTASYNQELLDYYKQLREYNLNLPVDERIAIIGVDCEHLYPLAGQYLRKLLPEAMPPDGIARFVQTVKTTPDSSNSRTWLSDIHALHEDMLNRSYLYRAWLGENYFDFKMIVKNISFVYVYKLNRTDYDFYTAMRDANMYSNFVEINTQTRKAKYFGQFGGAHISQRSPAEFETFATYLATSLLSPERGKVISINPEYIDCSALVSEGTGKYRADKFSMGNEIFGDAANNAECYIAKINKPGSPFSALPGRLFLTAAFGGAAESINTAVTDCFQYVLVVRNSQAAKPVR